MGYLDKINRFVSNPVSIDIKRSTFSRPFEHKTTFKAGKLVPIFLDEVLPGDTFNIDLSCVIRSITPAVPVMDNAFLDVYFFFVPSRLCTAHEKDWQKMFGENPTSYWSNVNETTLLNSGNMYDMSDDEIKPSSIGAYLGLPIGKWGSMAGYVSSPLVSTLPLKAYMLIFNEWFRDQNLQAPITSYNYYDELLDVAKVHDLYTSCMPGPQKGSSVYLPLGSLAPVIVGNEHDIPGRGNLKFRDATQAAGTMGPGDAYNTLSDLAIGGGSLGVGATLSAVSVNYLQPSNLWADLSQATAINVNTLREMFAIQKMLEKDARGGTRYREMLKAHFGVSIPDATVQVPEYLSGKRIPLNMTQVLQTSENGSSPLGTTGAFSNTFSNDKMFVKSFTEYGYIMGVACVRSSQSYSQGIPKLFTRNRRYDFYHPVFANLGEQAIKKIELYVGNPAGGAYDWTDSSQVFGYQEAWAEYRYKPNLISGELAPNAGNSVLSAWTYTNRFTSVPTLNSDFIKQPSSQFDNTFVINNSSYHFIADFYFNMKCTRPMPLYSIPGLVDHH